MYALAAVLTSYFCQRFSSGFLLRALAACRPEGADAAKLLSDVSSGDIQKLLLSSHTLLKYVD